MCLRHKILTYNSLTSQGVTWSFEIIENLSTLNDPDKDEMGCPILGKTPWIWIITDLINLFQGFAIFVIFVCKRQILVHLWRKQELLRGKSNATASTRTRVKNPNPNDNL